MADYILSSSSTADLSHEHFVSRDIPYVCYHYIMDGVDYTDDLGRSMPFDEFYAAMVNGADTKTSQVSMGEYITYFEKLLKSGKDVIHIEMSSGISGSFQSAKNAAAKLAEKYPNQKLIIIDSLNISSGLGLFIDKLADLRDEGMGIEELAAWANANRRRVHHWFFSTDLTFFVKGGRISKTAGAIGGMLGICPLMNVDVNGKLIPREKIRPKKRVIKRITEMMKQYADNRLEYDEKCYMCNSACLEDAEAVAEILKADFPNVKEVLINNIGTVIGSHTGPGTVAIFFWGDERKD